MHLDEAVGLRRGFREPHVCIGVLVNVETVTVPGVGVWDEGLRVRGAAWSPREGGFRGLYLLVGSASGRGIS